MQDSFFSINCNGKLVDLSTPKIMGILNLTPDSFSDGGKYNQEKMALRHAERMLKEGATFIDIGAQSTRPKAEYLNPDEEIKRLGSLISRLKTEFPEMLISLDTFYGEVVKFGYDEGIDLINDISAGQFDDAMIPQVSNTGLPYILMHVNPTYEEMHQKINYDNICVSINHFFSRKIEILLERGIKDIILDPGFGFGKSVEDQFKMINEGETLGLGRFPLLAGISRKSFIYKSLNKTPHAIDKETQELHLTLLNKGFRILRVHDVASTLKTIKESVNF